MNDEELINKAVELGMNISEMNEYTKPKLVNKYRDIYDSTNNRFEIWDKLENVYLNLVDGSDTKPEFIIERMGLYWVWIRF